MTITNAELAGVICELLTMIDNPTEGHDLVGRTAEIPVGDINRIITTMAGMLYAAASMEAARADIPMAQFIQTLALVGHYMDAETDKPDAGR